MASIVLVAIVSPASLPNALAAHRHAPGTGVINPLLQAQLARIRRQTIRPLGVNTAQTMVPLEITSTRDVSAVVRSLGGVVEADIRGRVTAAMVPANRVASLALYPGVHALYPSIRYHSMLDRSVPEIKADQVWHMSDPHGVPIQGTHVLVGVVDSGIDYHNPDFKNADGSTRIKYIWDQTQDGNAPAGYTFGYECDAASIDGGQCPERGVDPHGTHVAGIAAGNGRSSSPAREIGVAPQADLIVVKSDLSPDKIIAAWQYLVGKAKQLGEPIVINNSFGTQITPHDGSDPDAQAADMLSGPGSVFVVAAGNEGNKGLHTAGVVPRGGASNIDFQVQGGGTLDLPMVLFYPNQDQESATLTNLDTGESFGPVNFNDGIQGKTRNGKISITVDDHPWDNTHHSVYVEIDGSGSGQSVDGHWRLTMRGTNVIDAGRYDAWIGVDNGASFATPDESDTVGDPADGHSMISVGNYATRLTWTGSDGQTYNVCDVYLCLNNTLALGDIKASSSMGPTADGRQKPDVSAPGTMIISSLSHDSPICSDGSQNNCADPSLVTPDGKNYLESGTSMSSPHVAGVVALMLQVNPSLDATSVDNILRSTARHDQFTGSAAWTPAFGAGKVDALAAVQAAFAPQSSATPTSTPPPSSTPIPVATLRFHIVSIRVEKSGSTSDFSLSRLPLTQVKQGSKVYLTAYIQYDSMPDHTQILLEWKLTRRGQIVDYSSRRETKDHAQTGKYRDFLPVTVRSAGTYTLSVRATVNGQGRVGTAVFKVIATKKKR